MFAVNDVLWATLIAMNFMPVMSFMATLPGHTRVAEVAVAQVFVRLFVRLFVRFGVCWMPLSS